MNKHIGDDNQESKAKVIRMNNNDLTKLQKGSNINQSSVCNYRFTIFDGRTIFTIGKLYIKNDSL